jgi:uncharacterized protein (DUF2147 family)
MTIRTTLAAAALISLTASTAFAADPSGVWASEKSDEGKWIDVTIAPCGAQMCGTITKVHGGGDTSIEGTVMIKGMNAYDGGRWDDGEIYAADDQKWYDGKMKLISDSQLEVSGCVAFGIICRSQSWTRLQ